MQILDFYPRVGFTPPGERVRLALEIDSGDPSGPLDVRVTFTHLNRVVDQLHWTGALPAAGAPLEFAWQPPATAPAGYGAELAVRGPGGQVRAHTAFDVLERWTDFPRYGFVCDFSPGRAAAEETLDRLARFHINGLQFYDWQYRHDQLLPPSEEYRDPLDRAMSLRAVRALIEAAHARNMAAMPYLAVYAASPAFWRAHPDWALYDADGKMLDFMDEFLGYMNPKLGGPWAAHLLEQAARVLEALPFDGLHIDQYGEPHQVWDAAGRPVDLPQAFGDFLRTARERFPQCPLVFNAVANWPIAALASAPADFEYIEIWPPDTGYADLARIVTAARALSGGRPVVIALYLPAARPVNNRLADALIFASGGGRIELGESARLLSDPYFPLHQAIDPELQADLRRSYDFAVRYGEWIGPQAAAEPDLKVSVPQGVWAVTRRTGTHRIVHLINFSGLGETPRWDEDHGPPQPLADLSVRIMLERAPHSLWWASPERPELRELPIDYDPQHHQLSARLPRLNEWAMLAVEI